MQVVENLNEKLSFKNPVVTIGSFDGVHLGHRQIFKYLKKKATQLDGDSIVITFDPHPQEFLRFGTDFFILNSLKEKIELIREENPDYLIILPFTYQLASLPFTQFFEDYLKEKIGIKALIMGPNHSFGKNREANIESVSELCEKEDIEIVIVPELVIDGQPVRSQRIRNMIRNLEIDKASKLLGR